MGCGCKENKTIESLPIDDKSKLTLSRIFDVIVMVIFLTILTPFLLVFIWVIGIGGIINRDFNLMGYMMNKYMTYVNSRKNEDYKVDELFEVNKSEYELMDVDVIQDK